MGQGVSIEKRIGAQSRCVTSAQRLALKLRERRIALWHRSPWNFLNARPLFLYNPPGGPYIGCR